MALSPERRIEIEKRRREIGHICDFLTQEIDYDEARRKELYAEDNRLWAEIAESEPVPSGEKEGV